MTRAKLNLPEEFRFSTEIPIRIDDLNYGAHLGQIPSFRSLMKPG